VHVATPLAPYLGAPEEKTALEIGYGGGRLLLAASHFFGKAVGIDVHDCVDTVTHELRARGAGDFELLVTDGKGIPVEDESVDVVYSFIVLQHVQYVEVLRGYFRETFRVLKPGGVAILYCGRYCRHSRGTRSRLKLLLDRLYESAFMRSGYRELPAEVNSINLIVTRSFCVRLARSVGFELLKVLVSHKKVPDGYDRYGGQHGFVLRKRR
jgi:SAM-dependent methyltransferase